MLSTRHKIYVVTRPVDYPRCLLSFLHKVFSKASKSAADIGTLLALVSISHYAVIVEGNYYHLKRMEDDSLALDLTPFSDDSEIIKIPISKTSLSHAERLEIGELAFTCPQATVITWNDNSCYCYLRDDGQQYIATICSCFKKRKIGFTTRIWSFQLRARPPCDERKLQHTQQQLHKFLSGLS